VRDVEKTAGSRFAARRIIALSVMAVALCGAGAATAQQMSLPGNFAVNSNGAATYDIAIAVPPGTAGMVPSLKLSYSSQNGNGILGVGWTLSGLPSIARCAQTFAQDGVRGAVTFTNGDRFCMDGQRLVAINGSYGADGTEYRTEVDSYSRIISHGTTGGGPTWFQVYTKAGQIMEFGHTADSMLQVSTNGAVRNWALNKVSDTKGNYFTVTYTNNLTAPARTITNVTNSIETGEAYPSRIDYTGNTNTGQATYNSVQFFYATTARMDPVSVFQAGMVVQTTMLLTDIKTYAGTTLVSDYNISYQNSPATLASEIASIKVCATDGSCLPATAMSWLGGGGTPGTFTALPVNTAAFNNQSFTPTPASGRPPYLFNGDFNGDGKTDFAFANNTTLSVFISNGDGTFSAKTPIQNAFGGLCIGIQWSNPTGSSLCFNYYATAGDFNGDGLTDLGFIAGSMSGGGTTFIALLSNGDGTFSAKTQTNFKVSLYQPQSGVYFNSAGDFNGDGRTDFIFIAGYNLALYLSNGDGTLSETTQSSGYDFGNPSDGMTYFLTGDFNGDGKSDFSVWHEQIGWVFISDGGDISCTIPPLTIGNTTFCQTSNILRSNGVGMPSSSPSLPVVGDFNGDGKIDIGFANQNSLYMLVSVGNGYFEEIESGNAFQGHSIGGGANLPYAITGDFNGDGKTDFTFVGTGAGTSCTSGAPTQLTTFLNLGNGSFQPVNVECVAGSFNVPANDQFFLTSGDFTGDGKTDFAFMQGTSQWTFLANGPPADLVSSIQTSSPFGPTTTITYAPLTNPSYYVKANDGAVYPLQNIQPALWVVVNVTAPNGIVSNGVGGTYTSWYNYSGAKVDLSGRGFLGFQVMGTFDPQTLILRTDNYTTSFPTQGLSAFPCLGLVQSVHKQLLNPDYSFKSWLNYTLNSYTYNVNGVNTTQSCGAGNTSTVPSVPHAPYQVSVSQTLAESWDLDGTAIPTSTTTYQYDSYGNPTQIATSTPDGFSKTTTNTYTNNTTAPNWLLGRLTNATVTSTTP
jgi:Salmonella virulence plasmid 65kDa B protein/FG-GAP-like repeat/Insecticide toxin TcdB middle/N-terminal region